MRQALWGVIVHRLSSQDRRMCESYEDTNRFVVGVVLVRADDRLVAAAA
jgi:hypothetical protein